MNIKLLTNEYNSHNKKQNNKTIKFIRKELRKNYQLYLVILVPVIYIIIFHYLPLYGIQIAFKNYSPALGIWNSPWVGFSEFKRFIGSYQFVNVLRNTLSISFYGLLAGFPIPVFLALALNNVKNIYFKKTVQMVTYAPYFISTVVMVGIIIQFLSPKYGIVNNVLRTFGLDEVLFMGQPNLFSSIYVWSGILQTMGWSSIIYLSALSGIDVQLHEAAIVDGANRFRRMLHIDFPGILPIVIILLILNLGQIMNVGFEKALLMQNVMNIQRSEIISTYVYKVSFATNMPNFSYATAIGVFNSVINFTLLLFVNKVAGKLTETSLW